MADCQNHTGCEFLKQAFLTRQGQYGADEQECCVCTCSCGTTKPSERTPNQDGYINVYVSKCVEDKTSKRALKQDSYVNIFKSSLSGPVRDRKCPYRCALAPPCSLADDNRRQDVREGSH
ncbi:hypothetical protein PoB_001459000 [Plakobranchus ocellatus]|uniref:Uncharacterized protein n=1 Tax=Plakobranchus ocellatus TaxID=259542 RepID=A0AAV3YY21_9GAST|nr:hypothetical protein PoB_001459000 [Plakobranchus ocellatus]